MIKLKRYIENKFKNLDGKEHIKAPTHPSKFRGDRFPSWIRLDGACSSSRRHFSKVKSTVRDWVLGDK